MGEPIHLDYNIFSKQYIVAKLLFMELTIYPEE
jgi:hypothetical protein